jgi:hypothetical protein
MSGRNAQLALETSQSAFGQTLASARLAEAKTEFKP